MHSKWCVFMSWTSRDHPRLILDRFGKLHLFIKFSFFWALMSDVVPWKLICISILWWIWVCRLVKWLNTPKYSEYHQILTDRSRDLEARGKPSTWLPRKELVEQIQDFWLSHDSWQMWSFDPGNPDPVTNPDPENNFKGQLTWYC